MTPLQQFDTRAKGKFLLSGEYAVLDGALALAIPLKRGQTLSVNPGSEISLEWAATNQAEENWLEARFRLPDLSIMKSSDAEATRRLKEILQAARNQNPLLFTELAGYQVNTRVDFPREWGLGTSSTLIAALAKWLGVNPYRLLEESMGGSGYDLACAYAEGPVLYQRQGHNPYVNPVELPKTITDQLFFVFLGKKQNSREGIQRYRELASNKKDLIKNITRLTEAFATARDIQDFGNLMNQHEQLISEAIRMEPVKSRLFSDYPFEVKSLGAWGGDFVMVVGEDGGEVKKYFETNQFFTLFSWEELAF